MEVVIESIERRGRSMFELNLAHASILELLEKAAEKNEFIFVRQGQRRLGKTTALMEFARENGYPVLVNKAIVKIFHRKYPDVNIIGYVDGLEVDGLYNVVFDEGVPRDAIKRLYKLGILLTGFVRVDDQAVINDDNRYSVFGGYSTEAPSKKATPLLQIELEDIDSIPHVFYKGERITKRIAIDFEWRTGGADKVGSTYIRIKHGNDPDKALAVETKELAVGERAYE